MVKVRVERWIFEIITDGCRAWGDSGLPAGFGFGRSMAAGDENHTVNIYRDDIPQSVIDAYHGR